MIKMHSFFVWQFTSRLAFSSLCENSFLGCVCECRGGADLRSQRSWASTQCTLLRIRKLSPMYKIQSITHSTTIAVQNICTRRKGAGVCSWNIALAWTSRERATVSLSWRLVFTTWQQKEKGKETLCKSWTVKLGGRNQTQGRGALLTSVLSTRQTTCFPQWMWFLLIDVAHCMLKCLLVFFSKRNIY